MFKIAHISEGLTRATHIIYLLADGTWVKSDCRLQPHEDYLLYLDEEQYILGFIPASWGIGLEKRSDDGKGVVIGIIKDIIRQVVKLENGLQVVLKDIDLGYLLARPEIGARVLIIDNLMFRINKELKL